MELEKLLNETLIENIEKELNEKQFTLYAIDGNDITWTDEKSKYELLKDLDINNFNFEQHQDFEDMRYNIVHATNEHLVFKVK